MYVIRLAKQHLVIFGLDSMGGLDRGGGGIYLKFWVTRHGETVVNKIRCNFEKSSKFFQFKIFIEVSVNDLLLWTEWLQSNFSYHESSIKPPSLI